MTKSAFQEPAKKKAPKPSKREIETTKFFEKQLLSLAVDAYKKKEYLKSSMLSWSCIQEYFLPLLITYVAERQNLNLDRDFSEKTNAFHAIRYYLLISYDTELYELLDEARRLRNDVVHKMYKSGTVKEIAAKAQVSAEYNLKTLFTPLLQRLSGEYTIPSLNLYTRGWNDSIDESKSLIQERIDELSGKTQF